MTYTDGNIVQQLTERQQGKELYDALLEEAFRGLPFVRQNSKPRLTMRKHLHRKFGPVWGEIIWRELYFGDDA